LRYHSSRDGKSSLRKHDKVKDDAIVGSMHVIKWWCYNEGYRYNAYCSPSANYSGDWMEMNAIYECQKEREED